MWRIKRTPHRKGVDGINFNTHKRFPVKRILLASVDNVDAILKPTSRVIIVNFETRKCFRSINTGREWFHKIKERCFTAVTIIKDRLQV